MAEKRIILLSSFRQTHKKVISGKKQHCFSTLQTSIKLVFDDEATRNRTDEALFMSLAKFQKSARRSIHRVSN